jgi:hypothetical protein
MRLALAVFDKIRAEIKYEFFDFHFPAEIQRVFQIVSRAPCPRMVGIRSVTLIVLFPVDGVPFVKARLFPRHEVRASVRITARVFAQIVGVERDIPRGAKLVVLHLSRRNQVRISRKSARVVPCQQLRLARHGERERTVGQKQHTFRKRFVQTHRHRIRTVQADFDFVALVEYALVDRVDFRALRLPFDVIVSIRNRQKYHSILLIFYSTIYIITKLYYCIKQKSIEKIAINLDFLEIRVKIFAYFSFFCYNKDIKSKLCNMEEFGMAIINYIEKHLKTFSVTKHMHNDWEIIYVTEGSGTIETENNHIIP